MSYNISDWRTKILDALSLPLASLYDLMPDLINRGWRPEDPVITAMTPEGLQVRIHGGDCLQLDGRLMHDNTRVLLSSLTCEGEGSGTVWHEVLRPALAQSTGHLVAVRIWERGDSLDRLDVHDGVITETPIEL